VSEGFGCGGGMGLGASASADDRLPSVITLGHEYIGDRKTVSTVDIFAEEGDHDHEMNIATTHHSRVNTATVKRNGRFLVIRMGNYFEWSQLINVHADKLLYILHFCA
jgi:hypothetical protein